MRKRGRGSDWARTPRPVFGLQWERRPAHTHRNVPGCQRCQWGLQMRVNRHTLYSSNGQADGRLLCSLCLGWWLYSSGCSPSLQPCTRLRFIELSLSVALPPSAILSHCYLFVLFFVFSLHLFLFFLRVGAGVLCAWHQKGLLLKNLCCWGSHWLCVGKCCSLPFSFLLKTFFLFFFFFWHTEVLVTQTPFWGADARWQRKSHWTESNFRGSWAKAGASYLP